MLKNFILLLMFAALRVSAGDAAADLARSENLRALTNNKVTHNRVEPRWLPGGKQFWYQSKTGPDAHEFIFVDAEKGQRVPAFDHAKLTAALNTAGVSGQRADKLNLDIIAYRASEKSVDFRCGAKAWQCDLDSYALKEIKPAVENSGALPVGNVPRASSPGGGQTVLTFVNSTKDEVELFWVDTHGKRISYGKVGSGQEFEQHTYSGHVWVAVGRGEKTVAAFQAKDAPARAEIGGNTPLAPDAGLKPPELPKPFAAPNNTSPDGKWSARARNHNLILHNNETNRESVLTQDGTADEYYSERIFWAPDSKHFAALRTKKGEDHKITLVESSPKDQLQPKLLTLDYHKPGDRIAQDRPCLFDAAGAQQIPVSDALFQNPWSITELRWMPDSSRFTFLFNQRGHQALRVVSVDAGTGAARAIIDEQSKTFIDYSGKFFAHYLDATNEIVWMSERDGWNHLYLFDAGTGALKSQITKGEWVVRSVDRVDAGKRQIWFRAGGIRPGPDPYFVLFARVNFDGSGLVILTEGDGSHSIAYSPDGSCFIDTYSRVDLPPVSELRSTNDGTLLCELERAGMSALLKTGWRTPEPFAAKGRDGVTDIYGIVVRPSHFDPQKKYPVIEHIYAGPQAAFVPKVFSSYSQVQKLAELGFIVVQIDGMGTSYRSKKFHDVCWKNLGDSGFPDRILWMKAAAQKVPEMDLSRVGIYGGSAGGQSALRALLAHGDFYKATVADSGCHDNRMDKIWWNEQWMGWPIGPHYAEQSNVTQAHRLSGKLLLLAGELDSNVDPASTLQVVNALIKAGKDFEFLMVPGAGHGVLGMPYCWKRLENFFYRNLIGGELRTP
jgi:dipeptidyl aminopeptidase/acylaminoacyl peptidase